MQQLRADVPRRIELDGEYGFGQKEQVAARFRAIRADGPIIIDLTKVTHIDSSFLNELAALRLRFREQSITLTGANANVKRILKLAKFERYFAFAD
jgi:anti-anti-sigma factor